MSFFSFLWYDIFPAISYFFQSLVSVAQIKLRDFFNMLTGFGGSFNFNNWFSGESQSFSLGGFTIGPIGALGRGVVELIRSVLGILNPRVLEYPVWLGLLVLCLTTFILVRIFVFFREILF